MAIAPPLTLSRAGPEFEFVRNGDRLSGERLIDLALAALATASMPDPHSRFTVAPGTSTGRRYRAPTASAAR